MEIFVGALAAWGLLMLVWTVMGLLVLPLGRREDSDLTVVLRCSGEATWLERQVRGLTWLRDSGVLWWNIMILNAGLSAEAKDRALRLAQEHSGIEYQEQQKEWTVYDGRTDDAPRDNCGGAVSE